MKKNKKVIFTMLSLLILLGVGFYLFSDQFFAIWDVPENQPLMAVSESVYYEINGKFMTDINPTTIFHHYDYTPAGAQRTLNVPALNFNYGGQDFQLSQATGIKIDDGLWIALYNCAIIDNNYADTYPYIKESYYNNLDNSGELLWTGCTSFLISNGIPSEWGFMVKLSPDKNNLISTSARTYLFTGSSYSMPVKITSPAAFDGFIDVEISTDSIFDVKKLSYEYKFKSGENDVYIDIPTNYQGVLNIKIKPGIYTNFKVHSGSNIIDDQTFKYYYNNELNHQFFINPKPLWLEDIPAEGCDSYEGYTLSENEEYCIRTDVAELSCVQLGCPYIAGHEYSCQSSGLCSETVYEYVYIDCTDDSTVCDNYNSICQEETGICLKTVEVVVEELVEVDCRDNIELCENTYEGECKMDTGICVKEVVITEVITETIYENVTVPVYIPVVETVIIPEYIDVYVTCSDVPELCDSNQVCTQGACVEEHIVEVFHNVTIEKPVFIDITCDVLNCGEGYECIQEDNLAKCRVTCNSLNCGAGYSCDDSDGKAKCVEDPKDITIPEIFSFYGIIIIGGLLLLLVLVIVFVKRRK